MTARRAPPFRLQPPDLDEDTLHASVAAALTLLVMPPAAWTCFPAGNVKLPPAAAAKLARFGLKRGWPDLLLVHNGRIYGLELKRHDGSLSRGYMARTRRGSMRWREGQADVFPRLEAAGMPIAVCRSVDAVLAVLRGWGIPLRIRETARAA